MSKQLAEDIRKHQPIPYMGVLSVLVWVGTYVFAQFVNRSLGGHQPWWIFTLVACLTLSSFWQFRLGTSNVRPLLRQFGQRNLRGYWLWVWWSSSLDCLQTAILLDGVYPETDAKADPFAIPLGGWFRSPSLAVPLTAWKIEFHHIGPEPMFKVSDRHGSVLLLPLAEAYALLSWAFVEENDGARVSIHGYIAHMRADKQEFARLSHALNEACSSHAKTREEQEITRTKLKKARQVIGWCLMKIGEWKPHELKLITDVRQSLEKVPLSDAAKTSTGVIA